MISLDEALAEVLAQCAPFAAEQVPLNQAHGRVLAAAIQARHGWPMFDNSAVDGFGVRVADVAGAEPGSPVRLPCTRTIQAGTDASGVALTPGEAVRIFTGAMVPAGVEAVVMREYTAAVDGAAQAIDFMRVPEAGAHIRPRYQECAPGAELLSAGTVISPAVLGVLASCGCPDVAVYGRPRVAVIGTGDEILEPGSALEPGQIYDSNSYALAAALSEVGVAEVRTHRAADNPDALQACIAKALEWADVVLTIGGISVGDYDFVRDVCGRLGVEQVFWRIAMKPGKPNFFGIRPAEQAGSAPRLVFGLPGNPVSAMVSLRQLVLPAIRRMQGMAEVHPPRHMAVLAEAVEHHRGRLEFARGRAVQGPQGWSVTLLGRQGSHMIVGLASANCLILLEPEKARFNAGEVVPIELL